MRVGAEPGMKVLDLIIGPVAGWLIRLTPSCKEMTRLLSESMDRALPLRTRTKMRLHILICKWCERYKHQLLFIRNVIRRRPDRLEEQEASTQTLSPEARERLKQSLANRSHPPDRFSS